ncbi:MarR family winged helix-turn-helix transcriptional regulator [Leisingera sp. ANG-M1]|uniref:MarR family winged helix-turn-helix transcriptional regulator n=1 Tax=Leisingera sp. ANG-M1 TaxID=1577895 RepID=UPI000A50E2E8|nr:MarR family transcriptional regulator [Leisingera sp. ANG-M1]
MTDIYPVQDLLDRIGAHWPEASFTQSRMAIALIRVGELIRARTDQVLTEFNLTPAAFEVLVTLRASAPPRQMTPTELYRSALLTSGGMTKVLIELERRGAVERLPNPEDGRSRIVRMTQAGQVLAEQVMAKVGEVDRRHFQMLGKSDLEALQDQVLKLAAAVERAVD